MTSDESDENEWKGRSSHDCKDEKGF